MIQNTIIYLLGFPGTGKYTIAKEICKQESFRLVDNHLICNPVFSVIQRYEKAPVPDEVWDRVAKIRDVVMETMVHLSPSRLNFVLTNALENSDPDDIPIFQAVEKMAKMRHAKFVPIRLLCGQDENIKRVQSPERKLKIKNVSPERLIEIRENGDVFKSDHPYQLNLDVTNVSAEKAASIILEHVKHIR